MLGLGGGPVELVHQPPVGLPGGGKFLLAFFQELSQVQDGLLLGLQLVVEGSGAGGGSEAAAVEGLLTEEWSVSAFVDTDLGCQLGGVKRNSHLGGFRGQDLGGTA